MAELPDCARLQAAHDQIPEFAARADRDLSGEYSRACEHGLWFCCLADSSPVPYVAFVAAYERDGGFYLWLLGVRPDFRRNGLATSLFHCYLSEGARRGFARFTARAHSGNSGSQGMVRLLEAAGFSQASLGLDVFEAGGAPCARELLAFTLQR